MTPASSLSMGLGLGLLSLSVGCIVESLPAGELPDDGTTTADSATMGAEDSTGPGVSSEDPSISESDTEPTDSEDSTGPGDDTTTGDPFLCPQPEEGFACDEPGTATSSFRVRRNKEDLSEFSFMGICEIADVFDFDATFRVIALCEGDVYEIDLLTENPHVGGIEIVTPNNDVELFYSTFLEDEATVARHLAIRDPAADRLLVAAIDASELSMPPDFDIAPMTMEIMPSECPASSTEFDIFKQRAALYAGYEDASAVLFDHNAGAVGMLDVYAFHTGALERIHCFEENAGYNYADWAVHVMAFYLPEG